jgi:hypothetical protein
LVILASIFATQPAFAQNNQATSTIVLNHLNIQLTYPSQVLPGQLAIINLTAQAKDSFQLTSLTVQVYSADQNNLRLLVSTIVAANTVMPSGQQIDKQIQVTVSSSASRTSLIAQVIESVSTASYAYNPATNPYANPSAYQYGLYPSYPSYYFGYSYSPTTYYSLYPSYYYNYQGTSDDAIAPLSYVLATTPEYVTLQSQYQQLQLQNRQLQRQVQTLQNSTAQKDSTINDLNNQLSSVQGTNIVVEIVAVILAIALVAVAALHFKSTRPANTESHSPSKTEEKTTVA